MSLDTKYRLALKVFEHTAHYDALIADYRKQIQELPDTLTLTYEKAQELRYGENRIKRYSKIGNQPGSLSYSMERTFF